MHLSSELLAVLTAEEAVEAKDWEDLFGHPAYKRLMKLFEQDIANFKTSAISADKWEEVCRLQGARNILEGVISFENRVASQYLQIQEDRKKPELIPDSTNPTEDYV